MESLTLSELYHIMMMLTGVWVMVVSGVFLVTFMKKKNERHYRPKKK